MTKRAARWRSTHTQRKSASVRAVHASEKCPRLAVAGPPTLGCSETDLPAWRVSAAGLRRVAAAVTTPRQARGESTSLLAAALDKWGPSCRHRSRSLHEPPGAVQWVATVSSALSLRPGLLGHPSHGPASEVWRWTETKSLISPSCRVSTRASRYLRRYTTAQMQHTQSTEPADANAAITPPTAGPAKTCHHCASPAISGHQLRRRYADSLAACMRAPHRPATSAAYAGRRSNHQVLHLSRVPSVQ
jgi:hypothetical protein